MYTTFTEQLRKVKEDASHLELQSDVAVSLHEGVRTKPIFQGELQTPVTPTPSLQMPAGYS